jgi:hypothetical protein
MCQALGKKNAREILDGKPDRMKRLKDLGIDGRLVKKFVLN